MFNLPRLPRLARRFLLPLALLASVLSAADAKRRFDVPAGEAAQTLSRFAEQADREIVFSPAAVKGVKTNAVAGEFTAREALDLLVARTGLAATHDASTGAFAVRAETPVPNAPRAAADSARPPRHESPHTSGEEKALVLSPFEVTESNKGYYASNTMSGTRLNSKIGDLAASITVVTKEQMEDFALLGINDIFAYEASTEGTGNYTEFSIDQNGAATDGVSLNPQDANRIRGLGAANMTVGNFETSGRVPIDPIEVDAVEISRGPNSSIFGIGNTAGTVNSVPSSANLSRHRAQVTTRVDSHDGYRTTLDVNRVLRPGQLAVRGSVVYQHDGFNLKPSGTDTVRLNGMVKFRPFKLTTLSASLADYRMHGSRTNSLTPSDGVTNWIETGRPAFDPITNLATVNGVPTPLAGITRGSAGNMQIYVDQGRAAYLAFVRASDVLNPLVAVGSATYRESSLRVRYPNQPLFLTTLPVTDRGIYDWTKINLGSANYHVSEAQTATATLDQIFLSTARQKLAAQFGWFREQTESQSRVAVGIPRDNPSSTMLLVDLNSRLLDGRPSPYFGRPYLSTLPYLESAPIERDTYRAQVAYGLDFRVDPGWRHWLGGHSFSAYGEYKHIVQRRARWRHTVVSNHAWFPAGVSRGGNAGTGIGGLPGINNLISAPFDRLYVGDAIGGNVDYGPSYFPAGPATLEWGNGANWVREPVEIGSAVSSGTGLGNNNLTVLKSRGLVWQAHLLRDRIVPTFGWRHDESYTRIGAPFASTDGITFDYGQFNRWAPGDWTKGAGPTKTAGVVVKALSWLSLSANESTSFRPATPKQDLYLNRLPDPHGVGKDYGVTVTLWQEKLVMRFNRYITRQLQTPNGPSTTYVSRIRRVDFDLFNLESPPQTADTFNLQRAATGWVQAEAAAQGRALSAAELETRVAGIMKVPAPYLRAPAWGNGAVDDTLARGFEFEANYNPTSAWTMKLNVTQQETINERVAPELVQWVEERLPVWRAIVDPTTGRPWFTTNYGGNFTAEQFVAQNITSQIGQARAAEGLSRPQVRKYRANFSTNFRLAGFTEHKILKRFNVGGAIRWEDKGAIGYYGAQQPPALVTGYDLSRPIYDRAHAYFDVVVGYRTRLFSDKISTRFQLNVRNVQEGGRLQPVAAFPDGVPYAYRIIDPRVFILSATFDL